MAVVRQGVGVGSRRVRAARPCHVVRVFVIIGSVGTFIATCHSEQTMRQ